MESKGFKVIYFNPRHFDVLGLASDIGKAVLRLLLGLIDSLRFDHVFRLWQQEPRLKPILIACFCLNIVYFMVMWLIEYLFRVGKKIRSTKKPDPTELFRLVLPAQFY